MTPKQFNTGLVTRQIADGLAGLAPLGQEGVLLQNPDASGRFPSCVLSPPIQKNGGSAGTLKPAGMLLKTAMNGIIKE